MSNRSRLLALLALVVVGVLVVILLRSRRAEEPHAPLAPSTTTDTAAPNGASTSLATSERAPARSVEAPPAPRAESAAPPATHVADPAAASATTAATGRIFGRVLGPDGRPAVGRTVRVLRTPAGGVRNLTTDELGRFDGSDFAASKYHVSSQPDEKELTQLGLKSRLNGIEWLTQTTIVLAPGAEAEVNLGTPPEHPIRVSGRLTGSGTIDDTVLQWAPEGEDGYNRARYCTARSTGDYEIVLEQPGRYRLSLMVDRPGVRVDVPVDVPAAETFRFDVHLPSTQVRVRVVDSEQAPVEGAHVDLVPRAGVAPIPFMSAGNYWRSSDKAGEVTFGRVRAGEWTVAVNAVKLPKGAPAAAETRAVTVREDEPEVVVTVVLTPGVEASGIVRDERGRASTGVDVFVLDLQGASLTPLTGKRTDKTGAFTLPAVRPGRYRAVGAAGDRWTDVVEFEAGGQGEGQPIELTLHPAGRLIVPYPESLAGCWLDVRDERGNCLSALLDRNLYSGGYGRESRTVTAAYWLPRGNYEVRALATAGVARASTRVSLLGGDRVEARW